MPNVKWFDRKFDLTGTAVDLENIVGRLRTAPDRTADLVRSLTRDTLVTRLNETWSINENVGHLLDLEPLWSGRLDDILNSEAVLRPADLTNRKTHEANHNATPIADLLSGFHSARDGVVQRLIGLEEGDLARSALHPRLGTPMRIADLFFFVAEHDDHHLERIAEIIAEI